MEPADNGPTFLNDAFISYSRKDREYAARLEQAHGKESIITVLGSGIPNNKAKPNQEEAQAFPDEPEPNRLPQSALSTRLR